MPLETVGLATNAYGARRYLSGEVARAARRGERPTS